MCNALQRQLLNKMSSIVKFCADVFRSHLIEKLLNGDKLRGSKNRQLTYFTLEPI